MLTALCLNISAAMALNTRDGRIRLLVRLTKKKKWANTYRYQLQRISYRKRQKRLVLKNPLNTGRIPALLKIFPNAKFIFIHVLTGDKQF